MSQYSFVCILLNDLPPPQKKNIKNQPHKNKNINAIPQPWVTI